MTTQGSMTLEDLEAVIFARLEEMRKPDTYDFDTWLACNQALMQIHQTQLLQGMFELLSQWHRKGVPVYPAAT